MRYANPWFVQTNPMSGLVDIADLDTCVLENVPEGLAERIVLAHNKAINALEGRLRT